MNDLKVDFKDGFASFSVLKLDGGFNLIDNKTGLVFSASDTGGIAQIISEIANTINEQLDPLMSKKKRQEGITVQVMLQDGVSYFPSFAFSAEDGSDSGLKARVAWTLASMFGYNVQEAYRGIKNFGEMVDIAAKNQLDPNKTEHGPFGPYSFNHPGMAQLPFNFGGGFAGGKEHQGKESDADVVNERKDGKKIKLS
jgi:hypothetical protein